MGNVGGKRNGNGVKEPKTKDKETKDKSKSSSAAATKKDDKKGSNKKADDKKSGTAAKKGPTVGTPVKFGDDNENDEGEGDLDDDASFLDMLKGPRIVLPKPCCICGTPMKVTRYRDWDNHVDYCQPCADDTKAPHAGNLIGADDVDSVYPALGGLVRDTLHDAFQRFSRRPCLAVHERFLSPSQRASCDFPRHTRTPYRWYSYHTIYQQAMNLAAGLQPLVTAGTFVGICGPNRIEWIVADLACFFAGLVSVPLHVTLTDDETAGIVAQAELSVVICQADLVKRFTAARCGPTVKHIIVMDDLGKPHTADEFKHDIPIHSMSVVQSRGDAIRSTLKDGKVIPTAGHTRESLITILYTSGSTGNAKGVMIPDRAWNQRMSSLYFYTIPWFELCFQPLAHFNGRYQVLETLCRGGSIAMFRSSSNDGDYSTNTNTDASSSNGDSVQSMQQLFDDLGAIRPVQIASVPRMWNVLYNQFNKLLFVALTANKQLANPKPDADIEDSIIQPFRDMFGSRLNNIGSGSAAINPDILVWMRRVWNRTGVSDSYGSTEAGGISNDWRTTHQVEIKLRDVPDLGYYNTDVPHPRGEIIVRTKTRALGYWKQPEATAESFLDDGWFATGDVGQLTDGRYIIIDRCKNIFKLSQGEYVTPEKIEQALLTSRLISQIYVHGDPRASYVVAVVVPSPTAITEAIATMTSSSPLSSSSSSASSSSPLDNPGVMESLTTLLLDDIRQAGNGARLLPYEIPRALIISREPFTATNQLLTPNLKISRAALSRHYRASLLALYGYDADAPRAAPVERKDAATIATERRQLDLLKAVSDILGVGSNSGNGNGIKKNESLRHQAAIDSFSAVRMSNRFEELFKVKVPIATLLAESTTLEDIERMLANATTTTGSSSSSSSSSSVIDFTAETNSARLREIVGAVPKSDFKWNTIGTSATPVWFITGGTGFLGSHIIGEVLTRLPSARVIVLARRALSPLPPSLSTDSKAEAKASDDDGMARLVATMTAQLRWQPSFASRITVVHGDLCQPRLGLSDSDYDALSTTVTHIIHNGAHVNHALTYQQLRAANVDSLLHICALSIHKHRAIPISYVSTASTLSAPSRSLTESQLRLSNGYTQSKWVSERLAQRFALDYRVGVSIYCPGAIAGHSVTGACNIGDFVNRVICSSIQLGVAAPMRTRVSLVPVDFVAGGIVALSCISIKPPSMDDPRVPSYTLIVPYAMLWADIVTAIRTAGYTMTDVSLWSQWLRALDASPQWNRDAPNTDNGVTHTKVDNSLLAFRSTLNGGPPNLSSWSDDATITAIRALGDGVVPIPMVDNDMIARYLSYYSTQCHMLPVKS